MSHTEQPTLTRSAFPVTGQPIRVVMIDGEPWFATLDVCRILGRQNATDAVRVLQSGESRVLDMRGVRLVSNESYNERPARNGYARGNQTLNLVSESGLYTLIMRSRKSSAKPFQQWVTGELLPSLRRGDTDLGEQRRRMAETLTEAVDQPLDVVMTIEGVEEVDFQVVSDGSVLCRHGQTDVCVPNREEDCGPPFGPFFRCPELRRVGIRGSKGIRPCGTIRFVDVVRRLAAPREPETPAARPTPSGGRMTVTVGTMRLEGTAREIATLLHELKTMGVALP